MARSLLSLRKPLEPLELPTGHVVNVHHLSAVGLDMVDEIRRLAIAGKTQEALDMTQELLKLIMPEATEKDLRLLGIEDQRIIVTLAAGNIEVLEEELGNAGSAGSETAPATKTMNGSQPSTPPTKGNTSAPASRKASLAPASPKSRVSPTKKR